MKTWPPFNPHGDLPPGIHAATIEEIVAHFGMGSARRKLVARRLQRIYALACSTGRVARFLVFGSFITANPEPNDVDIFLVMDNSFDVTTVSPEARMVFDHAAAQDALGASIFWVRRAGALGGEEAAVGFWQIKRDGTQRGIVEVIAND